MVFGELEVSITFQKKDHAAIVLKALEPEFKVSQRYQVTGICKHKSVIMKIEANDAVALRAAANSFLRNLSCLYTILNMLEYS